MNYSEGARLITLGTAAGPAIRSTESGIASALLVDGRAYLIDFGLGMTRRLQESGILGKDIVAGFVTHLHSDHMAELPSLLLWNWGAQVSGFEEPVHLIGPGRDPVHPDQSGFSDFIEHTLQAYSYDLTIRELDEGRPPLRDLVIAQEIDVPSGTSEINCEPFVIYQDERVTVSAVLTPHPPVFPAFSFRIDSQYGSVTFSGDTAKSDTLVRLAKDTDILVHEAVNVDFFKKQGANPKFLQHQLISHTTPREAGLVATEAGAHHLVLSHFAGIAPDEFWLSEAQSTFDGPISVAKSGNVYSLSKAKQPQLAPVTL